MSSPGRCWQSPCRLFRLPCPESEPALFDEQMSDLAKARALALLPRLGLEEEDLAHLARAVEGLR